MKNYSLSKGIRAMAYSFILGVSLFSSSSNANNTVAYATLQQQPSKISGTITDGIGPIPGVTIAVKGKSLTAISDYKGEYVIEASPTDILVFSFMGFKTVEISISSQKIVNVQLKEDATALQEVKINAGYYSVKEKERTGSIAKITSKDIETQPVTNVLAAMQGRMAGVNITQQTGTGGSNFSIQIRGLNSLRKDGNAPLYIIDGVPYSSESIGYGITSTNMPGPTSPLNNINPADIESIEVLKDADATAIYGSRGSNGVVLVSTKKGKKGKTKFSGALSQGTGKVVRYMKMLNTEQYLAMRAEAFANDGITTYPDDAYDINGTWDKNRYTDWQKELIGGTAQITNINASVSGGSDLTQFLISTNYSKETTVFPGNFAYKKANVRLNVNHESEDKKFRINFTGGYTLQGNNQPSTDLTTEASLLAPNAPALYDEAGNLNWENNSFNNPLRNLNGLFKSKTYDLVANTLLSYSLIKNTEVKVNLGYTDLNHGESSTFPSTIYNPAFSFGSDMSYIFYNTTARQSWIIEPQLNWKASLRDIKTDILIGSTFQQQNNKLQAFQGSGFTSNSLIYNPAAASTTQVMAHNESVYKYHSLFGRINLNWKEKYIMNLTGRRDGSSRFGPGNNFAWFGAVGFAWIFSKEDFFKDNNILSSGKLRTSYGTTGSDQIGNYQFLNSYSPANAYYQGVIGLQPTRLYNANFGWETNKKLEIAIETGFFDDRLFFTAALYRNRSSDQLVGIPLPGTTGFPSLQSNLDATVENRGLELTIRTVNLQTKDFSWISSLNFSTAKNKLISFPHLQESTYSNKYVIGQPLNIQKVYQYNGIDPQTGMYSFEDVNGDGKITALEDKQTIKDLNPSYFGGVHNQFKYKRWNLDFLFQFVKQKNYNTAAMIAVPGTKFNQQIAVLDHWQQPGDASTTQIYTSGANQAAVQALYNYVASDGVILDASYVRLKNIALSFDFPNKWFPSMNCKARLESQNLLTITSFKGSDPESTSIGFTPPLRVITAGLQFNF